MSSAAGEHAGRVCWKPQSGAQVVCLLKLEAAELFLSGRFVIWLWRHLLNAITAGASSGRCW